LDLDKASEYLNIAATIIDIKARSLIPPPDDEFGEYFDEDDDPQQELIRTLEEYKMIKEEADKLKERETIGYFFKQPDKDLTGVQVQYKDLTLDGLVDAFTKMLMRLERQRRDNPPPREIPKDNFTVVDKAKHIRTTISAKERMQFEDLFDKNASTPEIVTTFQALLELLRNQIVIVEQEVLFGTIIIRKNPNISEEQEIGEFDEYH
jgi:segregation and condensation protein A